MRRRSLIVPILTLAMLLAGGAPVAAKQCTNGVACYGTARADTLDGTPRLANMIQGFGGGDTIVGDAGDDILFGDTQTDTSHDGDDRISGGPGNDSLLGGGDVVTTSSAPTTAAKTSSTAAGGPTPSTSTRARTACGTARRGFRVEPRGASMERSIACTSSDPHEARQLGRTALSATHRPLVSEGDVSLTNLVPAGGGRDGQLGEGGQGPSSATDGLLLRQRLSPRAPGGHRSDAVSASNTRG